jgi:polyphosphate kinase
MEALIRNEIDVARSGGHASITLKMNSLVDTQMIDALYEASQAGVEVDLIIRGICCLIPGVPGLSDHIRVRSIVGRYLEHSRIYRFANGAGPGQPHVLIGSPDLMPRNLDRRVEALVPVDEPELQARLDEILEVNLADDTLAWRLGADGAWARVAGDRLVDTHLRLQEIARTRIRRRA